MIRLLCTGGVVVDAMDSAAERLLASGMFSLCEGEAMPGSEPDPMPDETVGDEPEAPEEDLSLDMGAFDETGDGDLRSMTNAQLREVAEERGIPVPAKATKAQIVSLIEGA